MIYLTIKSAGLHRAGFDPTNDTELKEAVSLLSNVFFPQPKQAKKKGKR